MSELETLLAASVRLVQLERENALLRAQLRIANLKLERERERRQSYAEDPSSVPALLRRQAE